MIKDGKNKEVRIRTMALSVLVVFGIAAAAIAIAFYGFDPKNAFVKRAAEIMHLPAASVGASMVTVTELNGDLESVRKFYESQDFSKVGMRVDFSTPDGQKRLKVKERRLLNKLIENRVIEKLASDKNIVITEKMAKGNVDRELERYGNGEDVKNNLERLYGWSIDDFTEKIVKPDMYREELEKKMKETDKDYVKAKDKVMQAKKELEGGADFSEVAKKYSEGESAGGGGEIGWFSPDQMTPQIAVVAFLMKKGERSDVIETPFGFHIVQVDDMKTEEGVEKIKMRQIMVRTMSFPEWLLEMQKSMGIRIFMKGYSWNKEFAEVEFMDHELKDFEADLSNNSADDASVIF